MRSTWKPNHNYNNALISSRCTYLGCMISSLRCSRTSSFSWSFRRRCWVPFKPSLTASTVLWSQADWMTLGKVLLLSEPFISSIKRANSISLVSLRQGWNVILYANGTPNASCVQEVPSKCDPPQSTCASSIRRRNLALPVRADASSSSIQALRPGLKRVLSPVKWENSCSTAVGPSWRRKVQVVLCAGMKRPRA